jgi:hypothetical protein
LDPKLLPLGKTFLFHDVTSLSLQNLNPTPSLQNLFDSLLNLFLLAKPLISLMAKPLTFGKTFFLHG